MNYLTPVGMAILSLLPCFFLTAPAAAQSSNLPNATAKPRLLYFGDCAKVWSADRIKPLAVSAASKVSGVELYSYLRDADKKSLLPASASFFSHQGGNSYWRDDKQRHSFVLSMNYDQKMGRKHWSQKLMNQYKMVLEYHDASDEVKERLTTDLSARSDLKSKFTYFCARLMSSLFSNEEASAIFYGKEVSVSYADMTPGSQQRAEKVLHFIPQPDMGKPIALADRFFSFQTGLVQ